ncbi:uncharacterized protein EV154DRAFT_526084 [Mucor mucedo]|uniref:uncharacterized protein n=1 Tax=Mucor mucedo TaxID=29922 RepID=UPI00221E90A5|nr:uncharacterized protein EV154DRAFT_526084 [Mucor mucedo]KAI7876306.1 hypothetical protein EV154DRAFT_526084 [Mucor mucedo]
MQQHMLQPMVVVPNQHMAQPVFKTPAVPTAGLQIPTRVPTTTTPVMPSPASQPTTTTTAAAASTPTTSKQVASNSAGDSRIDYEALTDVMGYAGVDLKEEAEHFMKDQDVPTGILPDGIDRSKMQDFMNTDMLTDRILRHAKRVDIKEIDDDFVSYVALAAQDRIRTVMESMISASKHRTLDPFQKMEGKGFTMCVKQNVGVQLEALRHVARQTELDLDPMEEQDEKERGLGWYSDRARLPLKRVVVQDARKITVQDAIFVMERDVQGGRGTNQKTLLRAYNEWLS